MSLTALNMATLGGLDQGDNVALNMGSLGMLRGGDPIVIPPEHGGGGTAAVPGTWKHPYTIKEELRAQIMREDEELMTVIVAAMRILK